MTEPLSVAFRARWWVRPLVACLAVLGFLIAFVWPAGGHRFSIAVIAWVGRVGIVVEPPKEHHHACNDPQDCDTCVCTCSCGAVLAMGPTYEKDGRWAWRMPDGTFEEWK